MAQLQHPSAGNATEVVRIGRALNLALAALAQCEAGRTDADTMGALIERARDLADDLANAVDALPEPEAREHVLEALDRADVAPRLHDVHVRAATGWIGAGTA